MNDEAMSKAIPDMLVSASQSKDAFCEFMDGLFAFDDSLESMIKDFAARADSCQRYNPNK